MSIERRLNGLEDQIEPKGMSKPCGGCGGIHRDSPRLVVVQSMDELGRCETCGLRLDQEGRPWGFHGIGGTIHQKLLLLREGDLAQDHAGGPV